MSSRSRKYPIGSHKYRKFDRILVGEETAVNGGAGTQSADSTMGREKPKVVVIMGATGSGKSRLAIDLASHFSVEVINADSMQVYQGLDVLTNKVPPEHQNGVLHHLLGSVSPDVEFTAKDFRDSAIPVIDDILSRGCLPMIVGGTNYYIQALISPFLLDDSAENIGGGCSSFPGDEVLGIELDEGRDGLYDHNHLKEIDPVSANRIHPNNHRKINQYLSLYYRTGVLPSTLFQGKAAENWGQADSFRYDCCLICVDASVSQLDQHVNSRVDSMVAAGLLDEVYDIYNPSANYTRGLRQAIGVREFEEFLRYYVLKGRCDKDSDGLSPINSMEDLNEILKENMRSILNLPSDGQSSLLLKEAIDNVKLNTRRLVRRQRRQLKRLETLFGWKIHYVDATEYISCKVEDSWTAQVVEPAVQIIRSFLEDSCSAAGTATAHDSGQTIKKDLWTQYICKACGNKVLRGAHEWEQHNQGRAHRKRIARLKKCEGLSLLQQKLPQK